MQEDRIVEAVRRAWDAHKSATRTFSDAREEAAYERVADELLTLINAHLDSLPALREASKEDTPFGGFLRGLLRPDVQGQRRNFDALRAHPEVRFSATQMPIQPAVGIVAYGDFNELTGPRRSTADLTKFGASWSGGQPFAPTSSRYPTGWPTNVEGEPLELVLQVELSGDDGARGTAPLPTHGILQIFHDLETHGDDDEGDLHAWEVRWLDVTGNARTLPLLKPPTGWRPARPKMVALELLLTIPTVPVQPLPDRDAVERYERLVDQFERAAARKFAMFASNDEDVDVPWELGPYISRIGGFTSLAHDEAYEEQLHRVLPVARGDHHLLVAEVHPPTLGRTDWFHGGRPLQVWARESDVAAGNFDTVWCLIRTDS